ncbi:MAG: heme ABC transporter ATP-binding protein [Candidatus Acetothermia bacterium]|jgi:iron complex transport system ATP-binding protein|nr:heme ABC transporter ATP-binding protein [Candidatus Acetothermia bacterium]MDH7504588.1 heme ABC transporter ATP-binding protein [Candidatus Acetothermia bacterium]
MRISLQNLSFAYDSRPVLEGITLELGEGEILALVGPNGSGKSTLLRNLAGILRPTAGSVYLDFKELQKFTPRELARLFGAVEQERHVGFDFTVRELVELGRLPYLGRLERLGPEDRAAVWRAMALTHIEEFADRPISTLSGGERQRVFLAIALAQEPKALLLDEPTAHLDINYQLEIMEIIRERARAGLTVIMALHDLNLAAQYADRMALLHRGRVLALGRPEEVLTPERIKEAFGVEVAITRSYPTGAVQVQLLPPARAGQGLARLGPDEGRDEDGGG